MPRKGTASQPRYVVWLGDTDAQRPDLVGGKGANLARLVAGGFSVPAGFCVTAQGYARHVAAHELTARIEEALADPGAGGTARAAVAIRALFEQAEMDADVASDVRRAYERLAPAGEAVAVRSSATAEDLPQASFAGQQDTFLNVRGTEEVELHVRRCWASLWTERAIDYRMRHGFRHDAVSVAVVVQRMVQADAAGVMFTANPLSGRRREVVINASFGLGEAVASGRVTPDTFVVEKGDGAILHREIGAKSVEVVALPDGTLAERRVDAARSEGASLTDDQVLALERLGERLEEHFGSPQDVEWALADGAVQVLQCRPITALPGVPELVSSATSSATGATGRDTWSRGLFTEILPEAPCPVFCSVLETVLTRMLDCTLTRLGLGVPSGVQAVAVFHHQPYLNLRYIDEALRQLPDETRIGLRQRLANPFDDTPPSLGGRLTWAEARMALAVLRTARQLPREIPLTVERYYAALEPYRTVDLARRDTATLVEEVRYVGVDLLAPLVAADFLLIAVLGLAQRVLVATIKRAGLPDAGTLGGSIISGVTGNITMQTNKDLWRLAQVARGSPAVAQAVMETPHDGVVQIVAALPEGAAFREALDAFLQRHGHRETHMDIIAPSWRDDPTLVLRFVRVYLRAGQAADPETAEREAARRREEAAARVRQALARRPADRLITARVFSQALAASEALSAERDSMHYHWTAAFPVLRRILAEIGRRLTLAGQIDRPLDVYFLTVTELVAISRDGSEAQAAAARHRTAWERDRYGPWPAEIRDGVEAYKAPGQAAATGVLRGVAGSPGVAEGKVRIVRSVDDFGSLQEGDVLVASVTSPVWTPLFSVAAAVVTEIGGVLSHGAIVAREYGIPAVMGVPEATRNLETGQRVHVDGTAGTVTILEDEGGGR